MKLKRKNIFLILCIVATFIVSCFAFASCKDDEESQEETSLSIELSDETVNLLLGDTYQLDYTLFNNDTVIEDAEYTWTTENGAIATIENGKITAVALGQTTIEVKANYSGENATKTIAVNVFKNERLFLSESRITLYSLANLAGESFENTASVTAQVVTESGVADPTTILWTTENDAIATVENGVITAKAIGDTRVWATATAENGQTFKSYVKVNVDYPVVEKDVSIVIDKAVGEINGVTFADGGSQKVEKVLDVQAQKWMTAKDGVLDVNKLVSGEREYIVCNDTYGYKLSETIVADQIIMTSAEMEYFLKNATSSNTREKYFVLGANLDYTGVPFNDTAGFAGTFNGMGYSMYNVGTFDQYGLWTSLFGGVSGTIKNLALLDVQMPVSTDGVLADTLNDGAVIDNVFIHVKSAKTTDQAGVFCRRVNSGNIKIQNSLIWWEGTSYHRYCGLLFGFGEDGASVTFDNTYVIADPQSYRNIGGQRDTDGYQVFRAAMLEKNPELIYTFNEFVSNSPMDETKLSRHWNVTDCSIPTLSSTLDTMGIDAFVKIYNMEGEPENVGTAIKASEVAGKVNASGSTTNDEGYVATGNFEFTLDTNINISQLFFGATQLTDYTYDKTSGKLTVTAESLANVGGKDLPVLIRTAEKQILIYSANVVDYVFGTAEKLSTFLLSMNSEKTAGKMFALGADIDFTGKQIPDRGSVLYGDFDGMGHTIYNVTGSSEQFTGLFGTIDGGNVSNLSIVNGTITGLGGLFADVLTNGAKIDNVFIHVLSDTGTGNHGAIARWNLGGCSITNSVVWFDTRVTTASVAGGLFGFGNNGVAADLTGTYVIMEASCANRNIVGQRSDSGYVQFRDNMNAMNSTVVKTIDEFTAMQKSGKYGDIWNKTDFRIYVMNGANSYMSFVTLAKISEKPNVTVTKTFANSLAEVIKASDDASLVSTSCAIDMTNKLDGSLEKVYMNGVQIFDYTYTNETLTLPFTTLTMFGGEVELLLVTSEEVYSATVTVVEKSFKTAASLNEFLTTMSSDSTAGKLYTLAGDIDYSGKSQTSAGFAGTFDGKGYTVYNVTNGSAQWSAGLFGAMSGTVKNLGVIGKTTTEQGNFFIDRLSGTLDNVFIRLEEDGQSSFQHGTIAKEVVGTTVVKNTVVWVAGNTHRYGGLLFGYAQNNYDTTLENVYVINESATNRNLVNLRGNGTSGTDVKCTAYMNKMNAFSGSVIKTLAEFTAATKTGDFTSSWNTGDYKLYVLASAYQYLSETDKTAIAK